MAEKELQNLKLEHDQLLIDFNTQKQTIQTFKFDKEDQNYVLIIYKVSCNKFKIQQTNKSKL